MNTGREEDYLKAIFKVVKRKGYAKVSDVSRELGVGFSAVTEMFQKLSSKGYINYEKYGGVTLTRKGKKVAAQTLKKYKILQEFLIFLGIDKEIADEDACNIEHVVTPKTMERLTKFVHFFQRVENPLWLQCFKTYCEKGELPKCPDHKIAEECKHFEISSQKPQISSSRAGERKAEAV